MSKSDKLQRVRYFNGQVLGVDDFNTEQNYFIEKHRLHNRHVHGWGVVNGLSPWISAMSYMSLPA